MTKNLVLRTVYIDPDVDDELRNQAFALRVSKNDLFRRYLALGMKAAGPEKTLKSLLANSKPGARKATRPAKAKTT